MKQLVTQGAGVQVRQGADGKEQSCDSFTCPAGGSEVGHDGEEGAESLSVSTVIHHTACETETDTGATRTWLRVQGTSWEQMGQERPRCVEE